MNNKENLAEVAVLGGVKVAACLKGEHNSTLGVLVLPYWMVSDGVRRCLWLPYWMGCITEPAWHP